MHALVHRQGYQSELQLDRGGEELGLSWRIVKERAGATKNWMRRGMSSP